jgi:hypothetical protein
MGPEVMDSEPYLRITQEIVAQLSALKSLFLGVKKPVNAGVS